MSEFGDVVYSYSRKQAIEDGVLVDVDQFIKTWDMDSLFKFPVVMTSAVYEECMRWDDKDSAQSEPGRLWDILYMAYEASSQAASDQTRVDYQISYVSRADGNRKIANLSCHVGPGDNAEPVITIMFSRED